MTKNVIDSMSEAEEKNQKTNLRLQMSNEGIIEEINTETNLKLNG